jgi:O-antigen ligase
VTAASVTPGLLAGSQGSPRRLPTPRVAVLLAVLLVPLAFAPWREEVFAPVKLQVLQVILGLGLLLVGAGLVFGGSWPVRLRPAPDLAALAFGGLNLLAYAHSRAGSTSWRGVFPEYQGLLTVLSYLAAYGLARFGFAAPQAAGPRRLDALFGVLAGVTGLVGGYATLQRLGLDPLWGFASRPFGTIGQPNSLAAMLLVGLPAAIACCARYRGVLRVAAALAVLVGTVGLLTSLSRGGWLAAVVAGGVGLALHRPRGYRAPLIAVLALAAVLTAGLAALPAGRHAVDTGVGRAVTRLAAVAKTGDGSTAKHLALARIGVLITLDHPWLGIGQDTFPQLAQHYADERLPRHDADLLRPRLSESPHNALLSISAGAGLPALLAFLIILGATARRLLAARRSGSRRAVPVLVIMVGYLVSNLFITPEVSSTVSMWIVLGAACSAFEPGTARQRRPDRSVDAGVPTPTSRPSTASASLPLPPPTPAR